MPSAMNFTFSKTPTIDVPRSVFNRSHGHLTAFNEGDLIPIFVDQAYPGDTFKLKASIFARLATPMLPIMDNMWLETFYFAVPNRLVWSHWKNFMGEKATPTDTTEYIIPALDTHNDGDNLIPEGSLCDYMGLPYIETDGVTAGKLRISTLPMRSYSLIWNEWFRDQNLMNPLTVPMGDGPDSIALFPLMKACKFHDYFTSCLPWPQKGEDVTIGIGETAPVIGTGNGLGLFDGYQNGAPYMSASGYMVMNHGGQGTPAGGAATPSALDNNQKYIGVSTNPSYSGLEADLSEATAVTINALREAFQLQRMLEKDARGGTRYTEIVKQHFGVTSDDGRMQRPEFLGGSKSRVMITPVQQTSESSTNSKQGHLAAFGLVHDNDGGFSKSFTEHCIIIGLAVVRCELRYQQGIPRMFSDSTRYDFYWPSLAHLGEQEVLQKEIYATGGVSGEDTVDNKVFGYQERWAHLRHFPSKITAGMRSTAALPLHAWHLAQKFDAAPELNYSFMYENAPMDRVIAVTNQPDFICDMYFDLKCARPMPVYSVPGLIDHF